MRSNGASVGQEELEAGGENAASVAERDTLLLLNQVVAAAVTSIVVTDPHQPDNPIIFHNPAFEMISGYSAEEIDGHNCRFLQGPDTDPDAIAEIRSALKEERHSRVQILNYRKDGTPFYNELFISPVHDAGGRLTYFVGVQNDVTRRAEAEKERDVLLAQQQRITDTLQRALLLTSPLSALEGIDISTQYEPAWDEAQFGGDFFDYFTLDDGQIALVVGDLAGKGLKAAQHTAQVKYALRVLLREYHHPTAALQRLNTFLVESLRLDGGEGDVLACVSVAVVNTKTGGAEVSSAGMEPPLIVSASGETQALSCSNMLLGLDTDARYRAVTTRLRQGDVLVLVTDGVTETRDKDRRFFGYEGLVETVRRIPSDQPLGTISARIVEAVKRFAEGKPQDDICVLTARLAPGAHHEEASPPDSYYPGLSDGVPPTLTDAAKDLLDLGDLARIALDAAGLGYWELDVATGAIQRSLRHDQIFGFKSFATHWTYAQFISLVHSEDRARVDAAYAQGIALGKGWNFTCRIRRVNGEPAWIEVHARQLLPVGGRAARFVGTIADVTERKEDEARHTLLSELTQQARRIQDPDELVQETVRRVGEFLHLDRLMFADVDVNADTLDIKHNYCAPHVPSLVGIWQLSPYGKVLDELRIGKVAVNDDTETDPRTADEWEASYKNSHIRATATVPLFRKGRWAGAFSAHMCFEPRAWSAKEINLLETVARQMWLVLEEARVRQAEQEQVQQQRGFLRDMLNSLTEGRLHLCTEPSKLPGLLPIASPVVSLSRSTLRQLRQQVRQVSAELQLPEMRQQDLETAVGEAAMNAVVHGGGGEGYIRADKETGVVQVWIRDTGKGIEEKALPRALEKGASSAGTLGHGFWLMLKTCDRIHLLTGVNGTTLVLEQERTPPKIAWFESFS